jgi:hypothetical protein
VKEKLVKIALKDIKKNPARDFAFNPYNEQKIATLMESIGKTGFWANVIVRPDPTGKGYQQAYGHHRTESARRSGLVEAEFVVQDLDDNMMDKMMLLENQEDFRYYPLSMLESVRAVVRKLADGAIAPFYNIADGTLPPEGNPERFKGTVKNGNNWSARVPFNNEIINLGTFETREDAALIYRQALKGKCVLAPSEAASVRNAPSFVPYLRTFDKEDPTTLYTATSVAGHLGYKDSSHGYTKVIIALDALYLLEVKTIKLSDIQTLNWSQLGRFVADAKAERERTILRKVKTAEEINALNAKALQIQADQRAKEKKIADERAALVKKEVEAKREEDAKKAKAIKERIIEKDEKAEEVAEVFKVKMAAIDAKVEEVKQKQVAAKQEDVYLPIRRAADRIVHLLERRDEEEEIKALARKDINANDRERLRQAAIAKGTWYLDFVATQFLPPLSVKRRATKESK